MRSGLRIVAAMCLITFAAGCGSTVEYDPRTTTDATGPRVNLLVRRTGQPDLEVQERILGTQAPVTGDLGNQANGWLLNADTIYEYSVLGTATDPESGIRNIRLLLNRTVCFLSSEDEVIRDVRPSAVFQSATYTDPANAPTQASIGGTGLFDTNTPASGRQDLSDENLLTRPDNNGLNRLGVGAVTSWQLEALNFNGTVTRSNLIIVRVGDVSCVGERP